MSLDDAPRWNLCRLGVVSAGWKTRRMASPMFVRPPDRIERSDVVVIQQSTFDDLGHVQELWPAFEIVVGLWGRKMYG